VLTGERLGTLREVFASACADFGAELVQWTGRTTTSTCSSPTLHVAVAQLVNCLKGVSARRLRQHYRV
jgi:putative transposase